MAKKAVETTINESAKEEKAMTTKAKAKVTVNETAKVSDSKEVTMKPNFYNLTKHEALANNIPAFDKELSSSERFAKMMEIPVKTVKDPYTGADVKAANPRFNFDEFYVVKFLAARAVDATSATGNKYVRFDLMFTNPAGFGVPIELSYNLPEIRLNVAKATKVTSTLQWLFCMLTGNFCLADTVDDLAREFNKISGNKIKLCKKAGVIKARCKFSFEHEGTTYSYELGQVLEASDVEVLKAAKHYDYKYLTSYPTYEFDVAVQ